MDNTEKATLSAKSIITIVISIAVVLLVTIMLSKRPQVASVPERANSNVDVQQADNFCDGYD